MSHVVTIASTESTPTVSQIVRLKYGYNYCIHIYNAIVVLEAQIETARFQFIGVCLQRWG